MNRNFYFLQYENNVNNVEKSAFTISDLMNAKDVKPWLINI